MAASTRFLCVLVLVGLCLAAVQAQQDFMFVIGDDQPNTEDQFFTNYFTAMGYTYTVVKDEDTTTADAANYNAILISETSTANEVGDKFRDVPQAVVIYEHNLYDDMDMANPDDRTRPAIEILDNTHPITLGLPLGSLTIFDRNQRHAAGNVGGQSTATILATTDNRASLYVYEQGDTLSDGSLAPGIRMGLPLYRDSQSHLTIEGDALIKRAIDYVVTPPTTTTTSTTAPPNGGDGGDIDGDGDVDLDDLLNADSVGDIVNGITGNATYLYGAIGAAVVLLIGICLCCFCCCTKRCCCQNRDGSDGSKRLHDAEYLGTSALEGDSMAMTSTGVVLSEEPYGDSVGSTALASSDPRPGRKPRDRSVAKSGDEFLLADSDEWSDTSAHRAPPRVPKTSKPVAAKPARTGDMDTRHDSMAPPKPSR